MSREAFLDCLDGKVDGCTRGRANLIFSVFDESGRNAVEYARVLGALLVLSRPEWSARDMLLALWQLQGREVPNKSTMQRAGDALAACCRSARDADDARRGARELLANLTRAVLLGDRGAAGRALPRVDGLGDDARRGGDDASLASRGSDGSGAAPGPGDAARKRTLEPDGIFEISPAGDADFADAVDASPAALAVFARQLDGCRALVAGKKHDDDGAAAPDKHAHGASVAARVAAMRSDMDARLNDIRPSLKASTRLNA